MNITLGGQVLDIPANPREIVLIEGMTVEASGLTKFGRIEVLQPGVRGWLRRLKREVMWPTEEARRQIRKFVRSL